MSQLENRGRLACVDVDGDAPAPIIVSDCISESNIDGVTEQVQFY